MAWYDIFSSETSVENNYSQFNKSVTDIMVKTLQKCATFGTLKQKIVATKGAKVSGNRMVQSISFKGSCKQDAQMIADLQDKIATKLEQEAKAVGQQFALMTDTSTKNSTEIRNEVNKAVNLQTVNEMINSIELSQEIIASDKGTEVTKNAMEQTAEIIADASQSILQNISTFTDIENALKQKGDAKTENFLQVFADMFSQGLYIIIIIAVIIFALLFGKPLLAFFGLMSRSPSQPQPQMQQYGMQPGFGMSQYQPPMQPQMPQYGIPPLQPQFGAPQFQPQMQTQMQPPMYQPSPEAQRIRDSLINPGYMRPY